MSFLLDEESSQEILLNNNNVDESITACTQQSVKSFFDRVTDKQKVLIDNAFARFIFGCNIGFEVVDSKYFKELMKALRPAYIPPTSKQIASTLLDKEYNKFQHARNEAHGNNGGILFLTLAKYSDEDNVLAVISDLNRSTFLNSFSFLPGAERGTDINRIVDEAINLARDKYSLNVFAVISKEFSLVDNASNVWFIPCNTKIANLVANSLQYPETLNRVSTILHHCQNDEKIRLLLKLDCTEIPDVSNTEPWASQFRDCWIFQQNISILRQGVGDRKLKFNQRITSLLFDEDFQLEVEKYQTKYKSIAELIEMFQKDDCFIGDAIEGWIDLYNNANADDEEFSSSIAAQTNFMKQPVSLTANLLHPKYQGLKLSREEMATVNEFLLDNLNEDGLNQVKAYKKRRGIFAKLFQREIKSPSVFWCVAEAEASELSKLALNIVQIPASTINSECHFLEPKNLTSDQIKKLGDLYYSLQISDRKKQ